MGPAYHKGVPLLGVPENPIECVVVMLMEQGSAGSDLEEVFEDQQSVICI